jgi:hypothetical protein
MDETQLRRLLDSALADEPPIGPVAQNALRTGIKRRRRRALAAAGSAAVIAVAAVALPALTRSLGAPPASERSVSVLGAGPAIESQAASWVASQVSQTAIVSCDPVMCGSLAAHGIPTAALLELRPGGASPLRSSVIVATAAVRRMLGPRLNSVFAPVALATFGSGTGQVSIRVIAPQGAAAYSAALRADVQARKQSGTELLHSQRIVVSPAAHGPLSRGEVDSRLLVTISGLSARQQVSVVGFGDGGPGASPGVPLRSADLAETVGPGGPSRAARVQSMLAFLRAQRRPYQAVLAERVRLASGAYVLRIEFAAPSPLGLLGPRRH